MTNINSYTFFTLLKLSEVYLSIKISNKKLFLIKNERDLLNEKIILRYPGNADRLFFIDRTKSTG